MGNACISNQTPSFIHRQISKKIQNKRNLFQSIINPYQGHEQKEWIPIDQKYMYYGQWQGTLRHGRGLLYNKQKYFLIVGFFFENHLVEHHCKKIYHDQQQYVGQINSKYQQDGHGKLKGSYFTYEGQFKNGEFNGNGHFQNLKEQRSFIGLFSMGQKKNGNQQNKDQIYIGSFVDNLRQGQGSLQMKDSQIKYVGHFKKGKLQGNAKVLDAQNILIGNFKFQNGVMIQ